MNLPNKSLSAFLSHDCTTGLMKQDIDTQTISRFYQMTRPRVVLAICGVEWRCKIDAQLVHHSGTCYSVTSWPTPGRTFENLLTWQIYKSVPESTHPKSNTGIISRTQYLPTLQMSSQHSNNPLISSFCYQGHTISAQSIPPFSVFSRTLIVLLPFITVCSLCIYICSD